MKTIVVLESPYMPQRSAVEALATMPDSSIAQLISSPIVDEAIPVLRSFTISSALYEIRGRAHRVIRLRNTYYARAAMLDSLIHGEAPYASHLLYGQVLDDDIPDERTLGMEAGLDATEHLLSHAGAVHAFYVDLGMSGGMRAASEKMRSPRFEDRRLRSVARTWYIKRVGESLAWIGAEEVGHG